MTKTALVLSGGGARGAFQAAAEKFAREQCGCVWDVIAGVSVGALNAMMLAMEKHDKLWDMWNTIARENIYTGRGGAFSLPRLLTGGRSIYSNQPLREIVWREYEPERIVKDVRIGTVSLITGEYMRFTKHDPDLREAVLASTAMPLIWEPVPFPQRQTWMVDGAVRNISPVKDVLDADPDRIVVINCNTPVMQPLQKPPRTMLDIARRTVDIMFNEIFYEDVHIIQTINSLVKQAESCGAVLRHENGRPYRHIDIQIIQPAEALDDALDFSRAAIQRSMTKGSERARIVLQPTL